MAGVKRQHVSVESTISAATGIHTRLPLLGSLAMCCDAMQCDGEAIVDE